MKKNINFKNWGMMGLVLMVLCVFESCALMFGGTDYVAKVELKKTDFDAKVSYNGEVVSNKQELTISRNSVRSVSFNVAKEGCETQEFKFNEQDYRFGTLILSAISWGLVGVLVDAATGAINKPYVDEKSVYKEDYKHFKYVLDYTGCDKKNANQVVK